VVERECVVLCRTKFDQGKHLQQVLIVYKFKLFTISVDSLQVSTVDNKFRLLLNLLVFLAK
jgi:hypothetical protein